MNYNTIITTGVKCVNGVVKKADDCLGKALVKAGNAVAGNPKITPELATLLYDAGVDVKGKNARRLVEAALKNQALLKMDNAVSVGCRILTADPEPGMTDVILAGAEALNACGVRNTGFAKAADNARNLLSFRHEQLSPGAQSVIASYLRSPANMVKVYCN